MQAERFERLVREFIQEWAKRSIDSFMPPNRCHDIAAEFHRDEEAKPDTCPHGLSTKQCRRCRATDCISCDIIGARQATPIPSSPNPLPDIRENLAALAPPPADDGLAKTLADCVGLPTTTRMMRDLTRCVRKLIAEAVEKADHLATNREAQRWAHLVAKDDVTPAAPDEVEEEAKVTDMDSPVAWEARRLCARFTGPTATPNTWMNIAAHALAERKRAVEEAVKAAENKAYRWWEEKQTRTVNEFGQRENALKATHAKALQSARREALVEACKVVCPTCSEWVVEYRIASWGDASFEPPGTLHTTCLSIRRLIAADAKGGEDGK